FDRLDNKYCKLIEVPLELLCLDDLHGGSQRGIKLKNSDKIKSDESIKRISSLSQIVGSLLSEIPIIVRKYNGLFEVILGNHRAMCLINRGENNCKVLLIQDKEGADSISGADFL
ncbi:ParB N-terminal domain-containing protein, partial [Candidatus Pacearchaeota archaeon]|nr:ParB N-terminal domain-containing protein [Candidatus Pacearchaeota archaeon]